MKRMPLVTSLFLLLNFTASGQIPATAADGVGDDSLVRQIVATSESSAYIRTDRLILATDDGGATYLPLDVTSNDAEIITSLIARGSSDLAAVIFDPASRDLWLARSGDRGLSWRSTAIALDQLDFFEAAPQTATLSENAAELSLSIRVPTSSNFVGLLKYVSNDDGATWQLIGRSVEIKQSDAAPATGPDRFGWELKSDGRCEGFKVGCYQRTTVLRDGADATPRQISQMQAVVAGRAKIDAAAQTVIAAPPGGSTRISLNRGFDKCTAATVAQMQTWWDNSYFFDANIYLSGRNRGCSQPQLTAAWVEQVSAMGWGLIPTVIGYQSPCTASTTSAKFSTDPLVAEQQGRGEADIAVADAAALGLTAGTVLYYDMERYDDTSGTGACSTPTKAFLKGWTERLRQLGFQSGVYGSPTNAVGDWTSLPPASRMDDVWLARWDNNPSVWSYAPPSPTVPADVWNNHQRIKQWQAPHNETWGGVTFNIDGNIADGPVAGPAIQKNKNADFDGDGRTDISVYRPESGVWFVFRSATATVSAVSFGTAADILAPGDFDGDGKTDYAVFRPASGSWFMLGKAGTFGSRQFGADGDVPVPADFNGDGKTDIAVFRPADGVWYIANSDSRGTYTFTRFGTQGDLPVQADYDGDGKADIAVFRPSTGEWFVLRSSDGGVGGIRFGIATDRPAQGDFDGDGKADFAVFRDGVWYLQRSLLGFAAYQFGTAGDVPSTGDYDGDGKADIAVYRPSNGGWYLLQSTAGFNGAVFGTGADRPVPNAYLPQ